MLNAGALQKLLAQIDKAGLSVVLDPGNEDSRRELRDLLVDYKTLATQEHAFLDDDIGHCKLLRLLDEILIAIDGSSIKTAAQHSGLIVSYVRTMRGFITRWRAP
jgi:phosphoglycerate dehydrogenase-like enzyme